MSRQTWDTTIRKCKEKFDMWNRRRLEINESGQSSIPAVRPEFDKMMIKVRKAAGNWHCCAIGEKLQIPEPEAENQKNALKYAICTTDPELIDMGVEFSRTIANHQFEAAAKVKDDIRYRLNPERIAKIKKQYAEELKYEGPFDFD